MKLDFLDELTYVREQGRKAKHYSSSSFVIARIYDEVHLHDLHLGYSRKLHGALLSRDDTLSRLCEKLETIFRDE